MAFVPVANVAQVRFEGVVDGQQTINDCYFRNPGGIFLADIQGLVTNLVDWFQFSFSVPLSEDWSTVAVHARDLTTATGVVSDGAPPPTAGGSANEAAPNNVAACISFRTGNAGRSARGRNYIPAVPNNMIALNTLDPTFTAAMIAAYTLFMPGGSTLPTGWEWVVVSRFSGVDVNGHPIPRVAGLSLLITEIIFTNSTVDSQRRRLPGRGK